MRYQQKKSTRNPHKLLKIRISGKHPQIQSEVLAEEKTISTYLNISQRQDIFLISLGYLHLGCNATNSTDHIVVVPDGEAFKCPIAIAQQLLELTQLIRAQSFF